VPKQPDPFTRIELFLIRLAALLCLLATLLKVVRHELGW